MVALNQIQQTTFVYDTKGVDETRAKVDQLAGSLDKLSGSQAKATDADGKASASADRAAQARQRMADVVARAERQNQAALAQAASTADAYDRSLQGVADQQVRASQAAAQSALQQAKAANDNSASLGRQTSAYEEAGKAALRHPILAVAGASLAAKALSGLATSAGASLGAASGIVQKFGNDNAAMGQGVVAAAAVAARGLSSASTAAVAAGAGFGTAAEKMSGMTTATSLLTRGFSLIPPQILPIAVAVGAVVVAFELMTSVIGKANADFDKLIQIGERAEKLDVAAPFLKSFEGLAPKIRATTDEMTAALAKASSFVKDQWGQSNSLTKLFGDIDATGVAGAAGLKATTQADLAGSTQERIQAAIAGMKELDELGLHLASIQVGEKVFGPEFVERLRTGQVTVAQFAADLEAASQKEVLRQEQVDRALALNRAIADTKQGISDAWAVTVDFSAAGMLLNEAWLKILQAVRWVVETLNEGIAAVTAFGSAVASSIGGAFDAVVGKATDLLAKLGVITKQQQTAAEVYGPQEAAGPAEQKITARQFPYVFGPDAPKQQAAAAKQAQQAAKEAQDAYDSAVQRSKDQIQEFNLQAQAAGKASEEVYKLTEANRLRRAAASAGRSDEAGIADAIDAQAAAYARARKASEDAQEAQRRLQEGQRELASEFSRFAEDVLLGGTKIGDAFNNLAKSLSSNALKAIISGEGPLAGILGTAPTERGQVGGLLGGRIGLGSLFGGGSDGALQGPTLSGRTLDQENGGGFFSNLFNTDRIEKALSVGSEKGFMEGFSSLFSSGSRSGAGGIGGSQLMQGAAGLAMIGGSYGVGQQTPGAMGLLGGAASGAMGGAMLGSMVLPGVGTAIGAVAGAALGGIGAMLGQDDAKKQAKKKLQEEIQARREALEQARPQIEALAIQFEGGSIGNVGKQIADAEAQMKAAAKTASDGGDRALADKVVKDFQTYVARMVAVYADSFNGVAVEMKAGFGVNGPFSQAVASIQQLGEALKGFVADAGRLTDPAAIQVAREAAVEGALSQLDAPKTLSATQTELARINGTAAGLNQVLKDLGFSAEQTAAIIQDRTNKALDALRDKFKDDLGRKINDAQDKSYLNDAADLIKEIQGLRVDAGAVGGDLGQVDTYFQAAAQKIVDSSSLTGAAFQGLIAKFPELTGLVHEFSGVVGDAAAQLDAGKDRASGYEDRVFAAGNDGSTEAGQLAAFDRQAEKDRAAEIKAGGQAINELEAAQTAERLKIMVDFVQKATDAFNERLKGYSDRYFAAVNDATTLEGQLAAFDRQANDDRIEEAKAGGDAMAALEETQGVERLKIIDDYAKQATEALNARLKGYDDRGFAASIDTATLSGQLSSFDRQAALQRLDEIKAGGALIAQLEATQYAERARIITDYNKQIADNLKQQMDAAQTAFETFAKNIKTYLDNLKAGSGSSLSPAGRLAAAQGQYDAQLLAAKGGDRDALDSITTYSGNLLDASKGYNASSAAFQDTLAKVTSDLTALPTQVSAEQFIVNAIDASKVAIVDATTAMQSELLDMLHSGNPEAIAAALAGNFASLDTNVDSLLSPEEFIAGLGPLATKDEQAQARTIFNAIDTNGDGQLSQQEIANALHQQVQAATTQTAANVSQNTAAVDLGNSLANAQNLLLDAIQGLNTSLLAQAVQEQQISVQQQQILQSLYSMAQSQLDMTAQIATLIQITNGQNGFIRDNTTYINQATAASAGWEGSSYQLQGLILNNLRSANNKAGAYVYASGGWVSGAGTGTSDSIAARLSNGEFVIRAASAASLDRMAPGMLEALNDNGSIAMPAVALPTPVPVAGRRDEAALIAEVRALRAEVAALRATARQGNDIAEAGHMQTIGAVKQNTAAVQDGNAAASRQSIAKAV